MASFRWAVLAAAVIGSVLSQDSCIVSAWGPWSQCESARACPARHPQASFPLPMTSLPDKGSEMMKLMRANKLKYWANNNPEARPSSGSILCDDQSGMAGDWPCRNIDMLAHLDIKTLGYVHIVPGDDLVRASDIWGWTDPEDNEEYAIIGVSGGTSFVRVTDPLKPEVLVFLYTRKESSRWRDIKVINNAAYIGSEAKDHGMQVFNLLRLRGKKDFTYEKADFDYTLVGNSHNIVSNPETEYIYIVGATDSKYEGSCKGGLHFVDVSEPLKPKYAGCFPDDGYVHDAECVIYRGPDKRYQGKEICFCYNEDSLTLVDVTDKNKPKMISKEGYTGSMYTHQGWLTEDQSTLLMNDEQDEYYTDEKVTRTYIWDVIDLEKPVLKNVYRHNQESIDHNLYIVGNLTYQSNYGSGLRILHIDQENYDLREVAYFDTFPKRNEAELEGTWSNYPFYKSGNVVVSSIEFGLFIVRPNYDAIMADVRDKKEFGQKRRTRDVLTTTENGSCPALRETRQCEPKEC